MKKMREREVNLCVAKTQRLEVKTFCGMKVLVSAAQKQPVSGPARRRNGNATEFLDTQRPHSGDAQWAVNGTLGGERESK